MKSYSNDGGATWEGPLEDADFELLREAGIITPYTMVREEGGPAPLPTESGSPPPPPEPEVTAQLYLSVRGEKRGPYSWEQIREMLRTGQVSDESPIWYEGLPNWVPLSTILHGDGDEPSGIFGGITGLSGVSGFSISTILGGIFKHHTEKEMTDFFCCGSVKTTPNIREVDTRIPSPWIFARFLLWVVILYIGFYLAYDHWGNIRFFPSLLFVGSFGIPLCVLILISELNILKDISFYVICKAIILGALISFVFTSILNPIIAQSTDAYWAGPVEETAKLLAAILVGRNLMNGRILTGVLIGTAVGVGFAALESAGYAFEEFAKYYTLQCFDYMVENTSYVLEHAVQFSGYTPDQIVSLIFENIAVP
ncbi:MAG: GYF domain-containing protein [Akkermansia sp.]|nr:GYF domain-containing protein [Akkermansia sp.]